MSIFIISEIGINHNGDIDLAKKMIEESKKCGADAAKFQKREIDLVYSEKLLNEFRESPWGKTQRDQKKGLEFGREEYDEIDSYCKELNIDWFFSAWDMDSLEFSELYNFNYHKIASAMIVDTSFLKEVAKRKKHTFISTGMSTLENIKEAVKIFEEEKCPYELMHCVSTYPMKTADANLVTINSLKKEFNCNVGYSGHENGVAVSLAALMFGITSLERHITLDRSMYGSDQAASLEFKGMKHLTDSIDKMILSIGEDKLGYVFEDEKPIAKKLRAHIQNK